MLADVVTRRRASKRAMHLKLLTTPSGREVSYRVLHDRFVGARTGAAMYAYEDGDAAVDAAIEAMILRDCRKCAADQAAMLEEAAGSCSTATRALRGGTTAGGPEPLKPVR